MPSLRHARTQCVRGVRAVIRARAAAVLGCAAVALALLPAGTAHAAKATVDGGRLDWGIKASFQSYVTGPIAHGSWSLSGGADTVGSEQYRFPSAQGSYDPATGALSAAFAGGVHFVGHKQSDGRYQLDLTIARPSVRISGGSGTLYADMTSKDKDTGKVTVQHAVPLASLALGSVDTRGVTGPRLALSNVPATLTSQGARAFAGYYTAGTALDPVSLSVDLRTATSTSTKPGSHPASTSPPATAKKPSGAIADAAVDWGVRRTFREYVTGDIAKGSWQLAGGAREGGALFRFGAGKGTYDAVRHTLDARFSGSVRFLGLRGADGAYGLDLTLSGVRVTVAAGKGTLFVDGTPFVTFPAAQLAPEHGLITVPEAPTTLTAQGAAAFDGLYTAGTSMDPLTLSVALDPAAALPALPDIGSDAGTDAGSGPAATTPGAAPTASSSTPPASRPQPHASSGDGGTPGVLLAGLAGGVLLAAAAATALTVRARRRRTPATAPADAANTANAAGTAAPADAADTDTDTAGTAPPAAPAGPVTPQLPPDETPGDTQP